MGEKLAPIYAEHLEKRLERCEFVTTHAFEKPLTVYIWKDGFKEDKLLAVIMSSIDDRYICQGGFYDASTALFEEVILEVSPCKLDLALPKHIYAKFYEEAANSGSPSVSRFAEKIICERYTEK